MNPAASSSADRLEEHYARTVERLVAAHARNEREPLVLAIRFWDDVPDNICLLEVIENWPGGEDDSLFETEFGPSAELVVLGKLRLLLASPGQLRRAIHRGDAALEPLRRGAEVVYSADEPDARRDLAQSLLRDLGVVGRRG